MKRTGLLLVFCSCFVFSCAVEMKAQDISDSLKNQYAELDHMLSMLRDQRLSDELEVSTEQSRHVHRLKSRLDDLHRQY